MHLYPVFLNLTGARVLVAGAGAVGRRKLSALLGAGAGDILVLDTAPPGPEMDPFMGMPNVRFARRGVETTDVEGKTLVFAATGDALENARIASLCAMRGVPCNVATDPELGTFHVPSVTRTGGITAAFSTGGKSPALARRIREEAEAWLGGFAPLAVFMGRLRPLILDMGNTGGENGALFRNLVHSPLGQALLARDGLAARDIARAHLPVALHAAIEDLLDGLC